jgi:hypothetical protein
MPKEAKKKSLNETHHKFLSLVIIVILSQTVRGTLLCVRTFALSLKTKTAVAEHSGSKILTRVLSGNPFKPLALSSVTACRGKWKFT